MGYFLKYDKGLNEKTILSHIEESIRVKKMHLSFIAVVFDTCKEFEGKLISKRIATAVQKRLPDCSVSFSKIAGMSHIEIMGKDIDYKNMFSALIGYDSCPIVDLEKIKDYNKCYTLDAGRIERLEAGKGEIGRMVEKWNRAILELKAINEEAEKYELEYTFELAR